MCKRLQPLVGFRGPPLAPVREPATFRGVPPEDTAILVKPQSLEWAPFAGDFSFAIRDTPISSEIEPKGKMQAIAENA
jgi:hypothetical protein